MRAVLLAVVAAALVVPVAAVAADGQPTKALTTTGQSTAKSVLLKRGDLGAGFAPVARAKDQHLPKGARCSALDESDLTVTGDAASSDFRLAQGPVFVTVGSTAAVYRTLREANTSWSRGSTKQTTTCLGDIVRLSAAPGQKVTLVSATKIPFPSVSPKTAAYRIVVNISVGANQRVRAYVDAVILQHGRIQTGILFTSVGQPVGDADRLALARVLAARMAKALGPSGPIA
jgi:hypothetical protein